MMKTTIMDVMGGTVAQFGSNLALKTKRGGRWESMTWREYYHQVKTTARAFMALGLEPGKAVNILGNNCPQWFISDLAAIFAGAIPGGIYATSSPEQCQYIAAHSEANIVVVENADQLAKFKAVWSQLPELKAVVMMNGTDDDERVYAWEDLAPMAGDIPETELDARMEAQDPDDCCTLIYTSGTTGNPKGVMITHDNATWTARQAVSSTGARPKDELISYLPLSHIAEQVVSLFVPLTVGCTTWFAESLDQLGDNLREVRPTMFVGVPRVWEKIQAKMVAAGAQNSGLKKKIAAWARRKGLANGYARQEDEPAPAFFNLAHKLVFSKVHERLGLDRCRLFISTAAPISLDTLEFFMSLDIPITEVYGMSECTGPGTVSLPEPFQYRTGWAGPALPGTEIAVSEHGEVLMRGRHVFKGYFKNDEATRETIDADGWLHSGDVGQIDDKGFLKITDRMKELIITAGGENVPPQVLEGKYKAIPVLNQVVIVGDRRKHMAALFTLDPVKVEATAAQAGSKAATSVEAAACPQFKAYLQAQVDQINTTLPRAWGIKKFVILPEELSIEGGELTPTMKLKRRVVNTKYAEEIESMYT
ncbi:MAG: AMP-binding protein [Desulfobacteraceae bacterium]|nr:AMP-binding protein [Desulfobacteraceae bacterium]MBC2751691.1 AMP-binding protein [Desulfobacteraceae bacterium]